jgi:hypothetical protein
MAKKKKNNAVAQELPNVTGVGVEPLVIPDLDKAIAKYEKHKDARCAETPNEIASKKEMKFKLQQHRNELPKIDGKPFYRYQDRDYILDEKLTIKHVVDDTDDE